MSKALVCFSGGFDSTTCLIYALMDKRFSEVETIGFNYGQTNTVELECRKNILKAIRENFAEECSKKLGEDRVVDVSSFGQIAESTLTGKNLPKVVSGAASNYVPIRNAMFLSFCGARAIVCGADTIITGVVYDDFEGYADCRRNFMDAMQLAIDLGSDTSIRIETPVIDTPKNETWAKLEELGGDFLVQFMVENTHSCDKNDRSHRHEWGYGCGECESCKVRKARFEQYMRERKC